MQLDDVINEIQSHRDNLKELGHTVFFDLGDAGSVFLDTTEGRYQVTANPVNPDAECTITLSMEDLVKLMDGTLNPMAAFTMGKLKVFGSKGVALKFNSLLDA